MVEKSPDFVIPIRSRIACKHDGIAAELARQIRSGLLTGKLPGVTRLAQEYSVNPLTVCKALDALEQQGLIERRSRVGTFVKYKKRIGIFFLTRKSVLPANGPDRWQPVLPTLYNIVSEGISAVIGARQFAMLIQAVNPDDESYVHYLKNEVDGAVILHAGDGVTDQDLNHFSDLVFVRAMGQSSGADSFSHVTYDNPLTGILAGEYLRRRQCGKVVYVGSMRLALGRERMAAFRKAIGDLPLEHLDLDLGELTVPEFIAAGTERVREILARAAGQKVGFFISGDVYTAPIYQILRSLGREPVTDVPLVSCDNNYYFLHGLHPLPPEIDIQAYEIGRRSAELLLRLLDRQESEPAPVERILLQPVLRDSARC